MYTSGPTVSKRCVGAFVPHAKPAADIPDVTGQTGHTVSRPYPSMLGSL